MNIYPLHNWGVGKIQLKINTWILDISRQSETVLRDTLRKNGIQIHGRLVQKWHWRIFYEMEEGKVICFEHFKNSPIIALKSIYPEHQWGAWEIQGKTKGILGRAKLWINRRSSWIGFFIRLGYTTMNDWYSATRQTISTKNGGHGLLSEYYDGSPSLALRSIFLQNIIGYWANSNHKTEWILEKKSRYWEGFFYRLFTKLGYKNMDDWYNLTQDVMHKNGGSTILALFNGSPLSSALLSVYPEHDRMLWRSKVIPHSYRLLMKDTKEVKRMVEWLHKQLSINDHGDWYRVSF